MRGLDLLAQVIFPARCELCAASLGAEPGWAPLPVRLCSACLDGLRRRAQHPQWRLDGLLVCAPFWYEDEVLSWIRQVKQGGQEALLERLAGAWPAAPLPKEDGLRLLPVPAQALRRRERGGDHVAQLARHWAKVWGLACVQPLDRQGSSHQIGLSARERLQNLGGQYRLKVSAPRPGPVWLVDDVVTTGATLLTCRRLLERADWHVRGAVALALTPHPLLRGDALAGLEAQLDGSP